MSKDNEKNTLGILVEDIHLANEIENEQLNYTFSCTLNQAVVKRLGIYCMKQGIFLGFLVLAHLHGVLVLMYLQARHSNTCPALSIGLAPRWEIKIKPGPEQNASLFSLPQQTPIGVSSLPADRLARRYYYSVHACACMSLMFNTLLVAFLYRGDCRHRIWCAMRFILLQIISYVVYLFLFISLACVFYVTEPTRTLPLAKLLFFLSFILQSIGGLLYMFVEQTFADRAP